MRLSRRPRDNPTGEMSILEHIGELRGRLVKSCAALVVTTLVAFSVLYDPVLEFVLRSYCSLPESVRIGTQGAEGGCRLAALSPLEPLSIRIRLSLTVGLVLAIPLIAFQLWRFITPGLTPGEKRFAIPFALASTLLFAAGVAVAFFTLPKAIGFLVGMGGEGIAVKVPTESVEGLRPRLLRIVYPQPHEEAASAPEEEPVEHEKSA